MPVIRLTTYIQASMEKCFDLSCDIPLHEQSAAETRERAIAGKTTGRCEWNDAITWEATHFGIRQRLTVKISKYERPFFFEDYQLKGAFASMRHEHHFKSMGDFTEMTDVFEYEVPLGWLGRWFDQWFLNQYLIRFLKRRNQVLQAACERA